MLRMILNRTSLAVAAIWSRAMRYICGRGGRCKRGEGVGNLFGPRRAMALEKKGPQVHAVQWHAQVSEVYERIGTDAQAWAWAWAPTLACYGCDGRQQLCLVHRAHLDGRRVLLLLVVDVAHVDSEPPRLGKVLVAHDGCRRRHGVHVAATRVSEWASAAATGPLQYSDYQPVKCVKGRSPAPTTRSGLTSHAPCSRRIPTPHLQVASSPKGPIPRLVPRWSH